MRAILAIAGIVIVLDQLVKLIVLERLPPAAPVSVVDDFLALTLVMNPGLAFGLLGSLGRAWRWLAAGLSIAALLILTRVAIRLLAQGSRIDATAIGLIFGGAVGNLIDRARFGAVVDFVDVHYRGWHWPAFNVADSAITVGVALLAIRLLLRPASPAAG
jgi:signal peptidase II